MEASIEQIINTPRAEGDPEMASIIKELNEEIERMAQGPISPIKKSAVPIIKSRYPNKRGDWQAAQGPTDKVTQPRPPKKIRIRPYSGTINSTLKKASLTERAAMGNPASTATQEKIHKPIVREDVWLIDCSATKHVLRRNEKGELVAFDNHAIKVNTPPKNQPVASANTTVMPRTSQSTNTVKKDKLTPVIAKPANTIPLITLDVEPEVILRPTTAKRGNNRKTKLTTVIAKPTGTIPLITLGNEPIGVPPPATKKPTNPVALIEAEPRAEKKKKRKRGKRSKRRGKRYIFTDDGIWKGTTRGGIMTYVEIDPNKRSRKQANQATKE
ncbi:hypothetical protein PV325_007244 [Microctonus aethiopoides]|nr:hypothetical protein PV325_007244 [Microctonus aethiopoides]